MKPIFSCDMPIISTDTIPEKVCACLSWNPAVDESLVFSLGDFVAIAKIRTGQNDKSIVRKRTLSGVQIICLEWFTPGFIITIDATYRTRILSDQTLETIEEGSISSLRPVFSNYLKGALISPSFDGKIFLLVRVTFSTF